MISKVMTVACGAFLLGTAPVLAGEARIFPYATTANYCPTGFQPITINGVICCGVPNQTQSYQSMNAHAVARKARVRHRVKATPSSRIVCPVGEKGCYSE